MPRRALGPLVAPTSLLFIGQSVALIHRPPVHFAPQALAASASPSSSATGGEGTEAIPTATATSDANEPYPCASEYEEIEGAMPTEPPAYSSFSKSYYETHPRTANDPLFDCAWIEEIPKDLDEATLKNENETAEWYLGLDPDKDGDLFDKVAAFSGCVLEASSYDSFPCQTEYDSYLAEVHERAESLGVPGKGTSRVVGVPAALLAAVGVTLMGFS
ncbi:hypothetical protein VUR80DRAFT_107 [Thermomyces stellatus]